VTEALLRTARIAADDLTFLDKEIAQLWDRIAQQQDDTIILDKEKFVELLPAPKRHLLRMSIEKLLGNLKDIETRHIEEIMGALTKPAGKRISLPGGLTFSIDYNQYLLGPEPSALSPLPPLSGEFLLKIAGETALPGWRIEATVIPPEAMKDDTGKYKAYFDLNKTGDKLLVRTRQPGDRFQPLGLNQPKKLGEFMIDAKIPSAWRQRIPIVCSPEQILWVVGWRIDDRIKVTKNTKQILCLEFNQH